MSIYQRPQPCRDCGFTHWLEADPTQCPMGEDESVDISVFEAAFIESFPDLLEDPHDDPGPAQVGDIVEIVAHSDPYYIGWKMEVLYSDDVGVLGAVDIEVESGSLCSDCQEVYDQRLFLEHGTYEIVEDAA